MPSVGPAVVGQQISAFRKQTAPKTTMSAFLFRHIHKIKHANNAALELLREGIFLNLDRARLFPLRL